MYKRQVNELVVLPRLEKLFPPLSEKAFAELKADIAERGIQIPLDVTPDGIVLCGMNRLKAAKELGLERIPIREVNITEPNEQEIHAIKDNLLRRQLSAEEASLQRAAIIKAKEKMPGIRTDLKNIQPCSPIEQGFKRDIWAETAKELGVSKGTLHNDVKYSEAVEKYPELESLPKKEAIKTAKELDSLPAKERPIVIETIKKVTAPEPDAPKEKNPEEEEKERQFARAERFKKEVERILSNLHLLSTNPPEYYFQGLDEIEWAFKGITVFAENKLAIIDAAISWLQEFRKAYATRILKPTQGIRRVK